MESATETVLGEEFIAQIEGILRSYPEGIMVTQIKEWFNISNTQSIHAALRVLEQRGEAIEADPLKFRAEIYK